MLEFEPEDSQESYEYFVIEPVFYKKKPCRLIVTTHKEDDFIGVINAFRVKEKKHKPHA